MGFLSHSLPFCVLFLLQWEGHCDSKERSCLMTMALSPEGLISDVQFICERLTFATVFQSREKQKYQNN